jgi:tRNA acetyltransferase TAN1
MNDKERSKLFSPVHLDMDCVLFFKTQLPIEPVDFVHRICEEVVSTPGIKRMKYVNRVPPNTLITKATEKGLADLARDILGKQFKLAGEDGNVEASDQELSTHSVSNLFPLAISAE